MNNLVNSPTISVLMPVYNAEKYLEEAIESILLQSFDDFELIICYQNSRDNSLEIIQKFKSIDQRIILSQRSEPNLIGALNDGLKLSRGKYIARMDADDISKRNRFKKQVYFMDENPEIGASGSWIEVFGEEIKNHCCIFPTSDQGLKVRLLFSVPFPHPSVIIRREVINKHLLLYSDGYKSIEDYKFWVDMSQYTKFGVIPSALLRYRHLEGSVSKTAERDINDRFVIVKKVFDEVLEKLDIINSESEDWLHFTIGASERISKQNINLEDLINYINKLLEANQKNKVFDQKHLLEFLARKFLIVVFYKTKRKDFTFLRSFYYRIFYQACFSFFKRKRF
jgi:glycosyltransferase involved in cell wall biosynthesis